MAVIQKKICLLGEFAVGKTSLVRRFVENRFDDKYLSTIGVKISRKSLSLNEHTVNLLMWDLAGGDNYQGVQSGYLRGAAGALIVCDLTRAETLNAYERYLSQLREVNKQAHVVFLANKVDLVDRRAISDKELKEAANALGGQVYLTSAKSGINVELAIETLAKKLI